eukprot:COSAG05_NODE_5856_length_1072_cov_1.966084_1_plen_234_part_00
MAVALLSLRWWRRRLCGRWCRQLIALNVVDTRCIMATVGAVLLALSAVVAFVWVQPQAGEALCRATFEWRWDRPLIWTIAEVGLETGPAAQRHYTVVMVDAQNDREVARNAAYWLSCSGARGVHVIWEAAVAAPSQSIQRLVYSEPRVVLVNNSGAGVTRTHRYSSGVTALSDALFTIRADATVDCELMAGAFAQWRPDRMVGFAPRQLDIAPHSWPHIALLNMVPSQGYERR